MLLNKICKDFPLKLSPQASELNSSSLMEKMQIGPPTPFPQPLGSGQLMRFACHLSAMSVTAEAITERGERVSEGKDHSRWEKYGETGLSQACPLEISVPPGAAVSQMRGVLVADVWWLYFSSLKPPCLADRELEKKDLVSVFIPFTHLKFKKQLLYTLTE